MYCGGSHTWTHKLGYLKSLFLKTLPLHPSSGLACLLAPAISLAAMKGLYLTCLRKWLWQVVRQGKWGDTHTQTQTHIQVHACLRYRPRLGNLIHRGRISPRVRLSQRSWNESVWRGRGKWGRERLALTMLSLQMSESDRWFKAVGKLITALWLRSRISVGKKEVRGNGGRLTYTVAVSLASAAKVSPPAVNLFTLFLEVLKTKT